MFLLKIVAYYFPYQINRHAMCQSMCLVCEKNTVFFRNVVLFDVKALTGTSLTYQISKLIANK